MSLHRRLVKKVEKGTKTDWF